MQSISNFVDTSSTSLGIAAAVFILTVVLVKYVLDSYNTDKPDDEKRETWIIYFVPLLQVYLQGFCPL